MKRLRAFLALLLIPILLFALVSCKKKNESEGEAFFLSSSPRRALTSKIEVSLGEYSFVEFLNRGVIEISEGDCFGALDRDGRTLIEPIYSALSMTGDFFFAEGDLERGLYSILNLKGELIYSSDLPLSIQDVGEGCVSVEENGRTILFNEKGEDLLAGTSLESTYKYSVCGDWIAARNNAGKSIFFFRRTTGDNVLALYGAENTTYDFVYLGGKDFLILREEKVASTESYTYSIVESGETHYYRQTLQVFSMEGSTPHTINFDGAICSMHNRYSLGISAESRENYPLKDDYLIVRRYKLQSKVTDGSVLSSVTDLSLREVASLPNGELPLIRPIDGLAAVEGETGEIYLVNDRLELKKTLRDSRYQSVVFSGNVITASDLSTGGKRGCLDKEGNVVIPFEYSYISDFYGDKAIAAKDGKTYLIGTDGSATYLTEESFPYFWLGFYERTEGEKIGLVSFSGDLLVPVLFDSVSGFGRYGGEIFVAMKSGTRETVFRLF